MASSIPTILGVTMEPDGILIWRVAIRGLRISLSEYSKSCHGMCGLVYKIVDEFDVPLARGVAYNNDRDAIIAKLETDLAKILWTRSSIDDTAMKRARHLITGVPVE